MLPNDEMLAYRLMLTIDLASEEFERRPVVDPERMRGLLRLARADASALGGASFERVGANKMCASARPALRLVRGGRQD